MRRPSAWSTPFRTISRSAWPSFWAIPVTTPTAAPSRPRTAAWRWMTPSLSAKRRPASGVRIAKVSDEDASLLDHLGDRKLVPGRGLSVIEVRTLDDVVIVEDEDGGSHALGESLAGSISVRAA